MMKRILLAAACLFAATLFASAQQPDIEAHLKAHPELLAGTDYLCPTGPATLGMNCKVDVEFFCCRNYSIEEILDVLEIFF